MSPEVPCTNAPSRAANPMTRFVACVLLAVATIFLIPQAQLHAEPAEDKPAIEVDQVINVEATEAFEMFQFKPGLLRIPVGTRVRFLNMRGQHTVVSLRKMWPKDVPHVSLTNLASTVISFNKPGVYPFTCKVHGRYGMVMLIAVGDEYPNLEAAKKRIPGGLPGRRMRMLIAELEDKKS